MQAQDAPDGFFPPLPFCLHANIGVTENTPRAMAQTVCLDLPQTLSSLRGRDPIESVSNPNQRVIQHLLLFPLCSALLNVTATASACQYGAHERGRFLRVAAGGNQQSFLQIAPCRVTNGSHARVKGGAAVRTLERAHVSSALLSVITLVDAGS